MQYPTEQDATAVFRGVSPAGRDNAAVVGGAGMASADTWDGSRTGAEETVTQVDDNRVVDGGNVSVGETLNDAVDVGDVVSGNNVLNGVDADVSPDVDTDVDGGASLDPDTEAGNDNEGVFGLF